MASEATREKNPKTRIGEVVSDKMDKTVVRLYSHPLYSKRVKTTKRYKAHDENNECKVGDKVRIEECRPLSRDKHWKVIEIVERAK